MGTANNMAPPPPPPPDIPVLQPIGQGIDALFNSCVAAFDRVMTRMVNEGGLMEACGAIGDKISSFTASLSGNSLGSFSPFSGKDNSPQQEQGIEAPSREQGLSMTPQMSAQLANLDIPSMNFNMQNQEHVTGYGGVAPLGVGVGQQQLAGVGFNM